MVDLGALLHDWKTVENHEYCRCFFFINVKTKDVIEIKVYNDLYVMVVRLIVLCIFVAFRYWKILYWEYKVAEIPHLLQN